MSKKIGSKEDLLMANLIKEYIIFNPGCTAKDISLFFVDHKFSVKSEYTPNDISRLIKHYSNPTSSSVYKWFQGIIVGKKNGFNVYNMEERL